MRVFLAGIMQGSLAHEAIHAQDYRSELAGLLADSMPGVQVFDPWAAYPDSLTYEDDLARRVLLANVAEAARSDLVIAYLPQASMGTALEIWEAWRAGVPVVVISPMSANWVVRACASRRFDSLDEFADAVQAGVLAQLTGPAQLS